MEENSDRRTLVMARVWAAVGTLVIAGLTLLMMMVTHLSLSSAEVRHAEKDAITLDMEEEFIEVMNMPSSPDMADDTESRATADEQLESQPTPVSGADVSDQGAAGEAPKVATTKQESPMKVKEKEKPKTQEGPAVDKKKQEEEAIKRKADNEVANAFNKSQGKNNNSSGTTDQGKNGAKDGNSAQGSITGTGMGTVGGGWGMPNYSPVMSTVTGSVKLIVTIDRNGNVTNVQFDGGNAPAATNTAVRNACAAEVRRHKFTRSNPDTAPETSKAYITYTFK
ncbi:MAG: hypothetical protein LIP09_05950 [Bacteroidales bacterium]|nr:hypothetical protein [Bacteroidales bacterium]